MSPGATRFVVQTAGEFAPPGGRPEPLGDSGLVVVQVTGTPKRGWQQLVADDAVAWAAPVEVDDDGAERYPTGEVTVRFAARPSASTLDGFAADHGLVAVRRNEYVPEQVVFAPEHPHTTYLPELCAALTADERVRAAWPNTIARYRRA